MNKESISVVSLQDITSMWNLDTGEMTILYHGCRYTFDAFIPHANASVVSIVKWQADLLELKLQEIRRSDIQERVVNAD